MASSTSMLPQSLHLEHVRTKSYLAAVTPSGSLLTRDFCRIYVTGIPKRVNPTAPNSSNSSNSSGSSSGGSSGGSTVAASKPALPGAGTPATVGFSGAVGAARGLGRLPPAVSPAPPKKEPVVETKVSPPKPSNLAIRSSPPTSASAVASKGASLVGAASSDPKPGVLGQLIVLKPASSQSRSAAPANTGKTSPAKPVTPVPAVASTNLPAPTDPVSASCAAPTTITNPTAALASTVGPSEPTAVTLPSVPVVPVAEKTVGATAPAPASASVATESVVKRARVIRSRESRPGSSPSDTGSPSMGAIVAPAAAAVSAPIAPVTTESSQSRQAALPLVETAVLKSSGPSDGAPPVSDLATADDRAVVKAAVTAEGGPTAAGSDTLITVAVAPHDTTAPFVADVTISPSGAFEEVVIEIPSVQDVVKPMLPIGNLSALPTKAAALGLSVTVPPTKAPTSTSRPTSSGASRTAVPAVSPSDVAEPRVTPGRLTRSLYSDSTPTRVTTPTTTRRGVPSPSSDSATPKTDASKLDGSTIALSATADTTAFSTAPSAARCIPPTLPALDPAAPTTRRRIKISRPGSIRSASPESPVVAVTTERSATHLTLSDPAVAAIAPQQTNGLPEASKAPTTPVTTPTVQPEVEKPTPAAAPTSASTTTIPQATSTAVSKAAKPSRVGPVSSVLQGSSSSSSSSNGGVSVATSNATRPSEPEPELPFYHDEHEPSHARKRKLSDASASSGRAGRHAADGNKRIFQIAMSAVQHPTEPGSRRSSASGRGSSSGKRASPRAVADHARKLRRTASESETESPETKTSATNGYSAAAAASTLFPRNGAVAPMSDVSFTVQVDSSSRDRSVVVSAPTVDTSDRKDSDSDVQIVGLQVDVAAKDKTGKRTAAALTPSTASLDGDSVASRKRQRRNTPVTSPIPAMSPKGTRGTTEADANMLQARPTSGGGGRTRATARAPSPTTIPPAQEQAGSSGSSDGTDSKVVTSMDATPNITLTNRLKPKRRLSVDPTIPLPQDAEDGRVVAYQETADGGGALVKRSSRLSAASASSVNGREEQLAAVTSSAAPPESKPKKARRS